MSDWGAVGPVAPLIRFKSDDEAIAIVQEFLSAQFAGGRHQRRVEKINEMDRAREAKTR